MALLPTGRAQQPTQPTPPPPTLPNPTPPVSATPGYSIRSDVNLVMLRVSVVDGRGKFVTGMRQGSFNIFENKVEQKLSSFSEEDVPISLGLVIDNSGSMRGKRPQVNAAALALVKASNPEDEVFVVNFNDESYFDTAHDFTGDLNELRAALEKIEIGGATALYDAVVASADHLKKGNRDKKALLIITDGADNASRHKLADAVREAQRSDALIYAIGLFSAEDLKNDRAEVMKARRELTRMAEATGGMAFFPGNVGDTETICAQIAHIIRDQYTLAYYPTNAAQDGTFRTVEVQLAALSGPGKLLVRTRSGYYARKTP